jgi:hypothetical protein
MRKAAGVGLPTLPPSCADCLESREPQPPGSLRACPVLIEFALPAFIFPSEKKKDFRSFRSAHAVCIVTGLMQFVKTWFIPVVLNVDRRGQHQVSKGPPITMVPLLKADT